jgi:hypothetical protein
MKPYKSKSGKPSGVASFLSGPDFIKIQFHHDDAIYLYSYRSAGEAVVEHMKVLASRQKGLSTYISRHQPLYEKKY